MDILLQRIVTAGEAYSSTCGMVHVKQAAPEEGAEQPHSLSNPYLLPFLGAGAGALVGGLATRARRGETARERARRVIANALGVGAIGGMGGFALGGLAKNLQTDNERTPPGFLSSRFSRLGLAGGARGVAGLLNRGGRIARHNALLSGGDPQAASALRIQNARISQGGASARVQMQQNLSAIRSALAGDLAQRSRVAQLMGANLGAPELTRRLNALGVWNPHAPKTGQFFRRLGYGLEHVVGGGGRNLTHAGAGRARLGRGGGATAAMIAAYNAPTVIGRMTDAVRQPARDSFFDYLSLSPNEKQPAPPSMTNWLFSGERENGLVDSVMGKKDADIPWVPFL